MSLYKRLRILFCAALLLALTCSPSFSGLQFLNERKAYVGEEFILSPDPASIPTDAVIEWSLSSNVRSIMLRSGGFECAFTPVDTSPVEVSATLRDKTSGASMGTVRKTLIPSEFEVEISVVPEPVRIWNPIDRTEVDADELIAGHPVRVRAELKPSTEEKYTFVWTVDAATAVLSQDAQDLFIRRSVTGESELSVKAFNAGGVLMGSGEKVISVTLSQSDLAELARSKQAWQDWQRAQSLWKEKKYEEAFELARAAQAAAPRDSEITGGAKSMASHYDRYIRAENIRRKAVEQRARRLYDDALKSYRVAQVIWPTPEGNQLIRETEKESDAERVRQQKAKWLMDTASAYDQEGLFEEALDYYTQSLAVVSSDAVEKRVERIKNRVALIAEADQYAAEGAALEKKGLLEDAITLYSASLKSNPDRALRQHLQELQSVVSRRQKQAARLYDEGMKLERKGNDSEALQKYRESQRMWESIGTRDRIDELEQTVKAPSAPVRGPEDVGLGTQADAAHLVRQGDTLYLQRRLEEAAVFYRKALAMSPSNEPLRAWIKSLEAILRKQKAAKSANDLFLKGNALYREGKIKEAAAKYREGLAIHPNAEVESFLRKQGLDVEAGKGKAAQ
ncbi:MAG: hypothetical protein K5841_04700 [Fretibacterium sp.]|nr:hypothetical protein [Fretibacterium sp.]